MIFFTVYHNRKTMRHTVQTSGLELEMDLLLFVLVLALTCCWWCRCCCCAVVLCGCCCSWLFAELLLLLLCMRSRRSRSGRSGISNSCRKEHLNDNLFGKGRIFLIFSENKVFASYVFLTALTSCYNARARILSLN